jgi:hypothetical protein
MAYVLYSISLMGWHSRLTTAFSLVIGLVCGIVGGMVVSVIIALRLDMPTSLLMSILVQTTRFSHSHAISTEDQQHPLAVEWVEAWEEATKNFLLLSSSRSTEPIFTFFSFSTVTSFAFSVIHESYSIVAS